MENIKSAWPMPLDGHDVDIVSQPQVWGACNYDWAMVYVAMLATWTLHTYVKGGKGGNLATVTTPWSGLLLLGMRTSCF